MTLNQFAHGHMNPVSFADPFGMRFTSCEWGHCSTGQQQRDAELASQRSSGTSWGGSTVAPAPAPPEPAPPIRYTLRQFDRMSERRRLEWLDDTEQSYDLGTWFSSIRGVIAAGSALEGFMEPGTWSSIVDASILKQIQDGLLLHAAVIRHATAGARLWAAFFKARSSPAANQRSLLAAWAAAETQATRRGARLAATEVVHE